MKTDDLKKILDEHREEIGTNQARILEMAIAGKAPREIATEMKMESGKVSMTLSRLRKKYIKRAKAAFPPPKNSAVRFLNPNLVGAATEKALLQSPKSGKYILLITDDKKFVEQLIKEVL